MSLKRLLKQNYIKYIFLKIFSNSFVWQFIVFVLLLVALYFQSTESILVITALIIFYYTLETYKMRKAITENTELNLRPILVLKINFIESKAYIKNFNNFPAYNFEIKDYEFNMMENGSIEVLKSMPNEIGSSPILCYEFEKIDIIPPKDEVLFLDIEPIDDFKKIFFMNLHPTRSKQKIATFKATVFFDDILNNRWKMILGYSPRKIIATKPKKVKMGQEKE